MQGVILLGLVAGAVGFHTPYRPEQSRHFDVTKSSSFNPITSKVKHPCHAGSRWGKDGMLTAGPLALQVFDLHYADGSHLKGFNGVDQVWVSTSRLWFE